MDFKLVTTAHDNHNGDNYAGESDMADKVALYYSDAERDEKYTYTDIERNSNKFANVLKKYGIKRGDRVFIFMPRSPELYFSFLGICKVGGLGEPLFDAFMETALKDRLFDGEPVAVVTTPELKGRILKEALPNLKHIFVVGANGKLGDREVDWNAEMAQASEEIESKGSNRNPRFPAVYFRFHRQIEGYSKTTSGMFPLNQPAWMRTDRRSVYQV